MTGVLIGKFYPLHKGHINLIRYALRECDSLTVCVFGSQFERDIPVEDRMRAISDEAPNGLEDSKKLRVEGRDDVACDPYDEASWDYWVKLTKKLAPEADTLFSSEHYGIKFAKRLGMDHVLVDPQRSVVPISATMCRSDPLRHWKMISPLLRWYFAKKIVLVGAESTGKSTLAERLADHFETSWVPEHGRAYLEMMGSGTGKALCKASDLDHIAARQIALERETARLSPRGILFCDTDLMVTSAFAQYYFGDCAEGARISQTANELARSYTLHLLCSTDVPWHDDGTRDCTKEEREWFNAKYEAEMRWRKQPYVKLPADQELAFRRAVEVVDRTLSHSSFPNASS